jgi:hypothetical protein
MEALTETKQPYDIKKGFITNSDVLVFIDTFWLFVRLLVGADLNELECDKPYLTCEDSYEVRKIVSRAQSLLCFGKAKHLFLE